MYIYIKLELISNLALISLELFELRMQLKIISTENSVIWKKKKNTLTKKKCLDMKSVIQHNKE